MPERRAYLATVASAVAALAGCQSRPASPSTASQSTTSTASQSTTSKSTTSEVTTTAEGDVSVDDVTARKAVRYVSSLGSGGVLAGSDRQYVVAEVRAPRDVSPSSFAFVAGDQSWSPGLPETTGGVNLTVADRGDGPLGRPVGADATSYLAFTVPSPLSASNPRIEYRSNGGATWPLSSAASETLAAAAPAFELRSLSVPGSVTRGDPLSVSLTAANVSETDGRLLAALYWPTTIADDDESHVVERDVEAGETVSASLDVRTEYTDGEREATLTVRGHVSAERTVALEDA